MHCVDIENIVIARIVVDYIENNVITVPTTCSRPSIEMIGFMYVCMYVFINVFLRVHSPGHTVIYF